MTQATHPSRDPHSSGTGRDIAFLTAFAILGGLYVVLIAALLIADIAYLFRQESPSKESGVAHALDLLVGPLRSPEIRYAVRLSLLSCSVTAMLSLFVAVPLGYLLSRFRFPGKGLVDALLDIPIVLPPLVIGLSLLLLFQTPPGRALDRLFPITYAIPSIILAQFTVSAAFAVRTMRVTFDGIGSRTEQVALTLGCGRAGAFWRVVLPQAGRGMVTAWTLSWARALGEFGPILVFSGATRRHTEVLPTTVFLELSVGNLDAAVAVSLLMVLAAVIVLVVVRVLGTDPSVRKA